MSQSVRKVRVLINRAFALRRNTMSTYDTQQKATIGFVGIGHMGSLLCQRLLQAGYGVTVYDRTKEKTQEPAQHGAKVAESLRDLAATCQIFITMVTNDQAVDDMVLGPDGILAGARPQTTLIDMSTVYPHTSRKLYEAAKEKHIHMIDAAVSGSTPQAKEGSLLIFVGGEQETYQQCKPVLEVMGKTSFYMGESGSGTTMKLVVNTLLGLGLQAVAEAISLGEKAGLDKKHLLDVLGQTTVISPAHKSKLVNVEKEQYPTNFALAMMRKDFGLIMRLAAEVSACMPAT